MQSTAYNTPRTLAETDAVIFKRFLGANPEWFSQAALVAATAIQKIDPLDIEEWPTAHNEIDQWLKATFAADWPKVSDDTWWEVAGWLLEIVPV